MRRVVAASLAACSFLALALSLVSGCPSRNLEVQITTDGANTLVEACESFRNACEPLSCHKNKFLCDQDTCALRQQCQVTDNPEWAPEVGMGMRLLLLQLDTSDLSIEEASICVPLNLRPCIRDTLGVAGCPCISDPLGNTTCAPDPTGDATLACIRDTIAQAVQAAIGSGMTFSGFTNTDNVALIAAFFTKEGGETPCDGGVLVNPSDCVPGHLTAVAGLGAPSGANTYDITCASCQGGPHESFGNDNAPCPVTTDSCFLQRVESALATSGM